MDIIKWSFFNGLDVDVHPGTSEVFKHQQQGLARQTRTLSDISAQHGLNGLDHRANGFTLCVVSGLKAESHEGGEVNKRRAKPRR